MFSALPYNRLLLERAPGKGDRGSRLWIHYLEGFQESVVPRDIRPSSYPRPQRVVIKGVERG